MKNRKSFWPPVTLMLVLVVCFYIELIHYIHASREKDRRNICRSHATLFISEYSHLRKDMSSAAAHCVTTKDLSAQAEFLEKMAMQERLMSCILIPDENGWESYRLGPSLTAYRNEIFLKAASNARLLPSEAKIFRNLISVSGELTEIERAAVEAAKLSTANSNHETADQGALASKSYLQLTAKSDMLYKDLKDLVLRGNWHSQQEASNEAARHLRWVVRLSIIHAGLLIGLAWLGKVRLSRVERRATHDPLTDLPNRWRLEMYLKWVCSRAEARGESVILAFIDLNGFKPINDTLGHDSGDYILKYVADRLKENCRANDMASRFGGDEFVVVFVSPANRRDESLGRLRKLLHSTFDEACELGQGLKFGAAIGISMFPSRATSMENLIETADRAMYEAKKRAQDSKEGLTIVEFPKMLTGDAIPFDLSESRC